jgi:transcriptional regulator with XRE-family HTH domain
MTMPHLTAHQYAGLQRWYAVPDGSRVRQLRRQRGLTQEKLASMAGVSTSTVTRLERQYRAFCRSYILARIAAVLGEHPARLLKSPGPCPPVSYAARAGTTSVHGGTRRESDPRDVLAIAGRAKVPA